MGTDGAVVSMLPHQESLKDIYIKITYISHQLNQGRAGKETMSNEQFANIAFLWANVCASHTGKLSLQQSRVENSKYLLCTSWSRAQPSVSRILADHFFLICVKGSYYLIFFSFV